MKFKIIKKTIENVVLYTSKLPKLTFEMYVHESIKIIHFPW